MSISKAGKNQWADASPQKKNPFELPRLIARQIKQCAEIHSQTVAPVDNVKYLWINYGTADFVDGGENPTRRVLNADEWKNVVDEAASLGVRSLVICTGNGLVQSEDLWQVCQWAQKAHDMSVSLHLSGPFDLALLQNLGRLDATRTCLLVPQAKFQDVQTFIEAGIKVCVADVASEDHPMPCSGPRSMVYVGSEGKLYPCGLVHGNDQYLLGDILEDPLVPIRRNDSLPWSVSPSDCQGRANCDACPNVMEKRLAGSSS